MGPPAALACAPRRLAALRPDARRWADGAVAHDLADDASVWRPTARDGLRRRSRATTTLLAGPAGTVHFAGEHTAGAWSGLMEGALAVDCARRPKLLSPRESGHDLLRQDEGGLHGRQTKATIAAALTGTAVLAIVPALTGATGKHGHGERGHHGHGDRARNVILLQGDGMATAQRDLHPADHVGNRKAAISR